MIDTAEKLCDEIVQLMMHNQEVDTVNNITTPDSVVEHVIDIVTIVDGYAYDVHIIVCRHGKI